MTQSVRTLLFTDVEGSTKLLERAGDDYAELLTAHRQIVRRALAAGGAVEHGTEGDSFFASFDSPSRAIAAATTAQLELEAHPWPNGMAMRVRMGLHLGEVSDAEDGLIGLAVHHAARIASAGHGGQIIVSEPLRAMLRSLPDGTALRSLGQFRLRDVGLMTLFQVDHPALQANFPELRGIVVRSNLPRPVTMMVGAAELLETIDTASRTARVLTLTGTGGVGKTRAALEFGWRCADRFADGVHFVDLAPLTADGAVPSTVARELHIMTGSDTSVAEAVMEWIAERSMMLLLDNCEHLLPEVAPFVDDIVAQCPQTLVLATSREPLDLTGERVVRIPSLAVDSDALALFGQRALDADPTFSLANHREAVEQICKRLDGIPLAIELAAARMSVMSPDELLGRLQNRFRLLRGSGRSLDRHRTLQATVSWSYQLLNDDERCLFERLSVFSGGASLAEAEGVCGTLPLEPEDVLDLLQSLVSKSMVVAERGTVGTRYRMLETLRQFAEERVEAAEATAELRTRHLHHITEVAAQLDELVRTADERSARAAMLAEWDNIRTAWLWALATDDLERAERLVSSTLLTALHSVLLEHEDWARRTVELSRSLDRPSAEMLAELAYWRNHLGDEPEAMALATEGITLAPFPEHPSTIRCWSMLSGASPSYLPETPEAVSAFEHQAAAIRNLDDIDRDWWALVEQMDNSLNAAPVLSASILERLHDVAMRVRAPQLMTYAHMFRGHTLLLQRPDPDLLGAIEAYEQGLALAQSNGDVQTEAILLRGLALVSTALGRESAMEECRVALEHLYEIRYWQKIWQVCDSVALALTQAARFDEASVVIGHLDAHMPSYGLEQDLQFRPRAHAALEPATVDPRHARRGASMTGDELVAEILRMLSETQPGVQLGQE